MAISGAHVQCGYVKDVRGAKLFFPLWSETITLGQSTTQVAPTLSAPEDAASLVFRVRAPASGEMLSAVGTAPDAGQAVGSSQNTARSHHVASEEKDIPAQAGWKCNVVSA
ncbi:hypothetical protein [Rhizobium lentis]|uniref:Uncharacterized protein n=1 Tax=Rhizobium lentis TaxID=1138194 RepID=A0A7W8UMF0_9HYPH|nr:hypothetical protein [Rhizobium lentis]MBB4574374.1 hypothetical protein [Rhizobium lentis]MBB5550300.1 hypothetical protein [Rhizobium lentis]MBB5560671.1 hypothetical protein [Rhizobium lentis]MBB5567256.1 hypothetical protein [Rhizobium lentis]